MSHKQHVNKDIKILCENTTSSHSYMFFLMRIYILENFMVWEPA
jgi:hypothetical protein